MQTKSPDTGTKSSSTARKEVRPETKIVSESAPTSDPAELEKDGTAVPTNPLAPADAQEADGVVNAQASCPGTTTCNFEPIVTSVEYIQTMDLDGVQQALQASVGEYQKHEVQAISSSKLMLAHGWKVGHLLNHGKALLKGAESTKFGTWRAELLIRPGYMSVKTAQRYMALAKHWTDLDSLLSAKANLWEAYQEAGILPPDAEAKKSEISSTVSEKVSDDEEKGLKDGQYHLEKFRMEYAKIQKLLSIILQHKAAALREEIPSEKLVLPEEDRVQFQLVLTQINEFANSLIGGEP